MFVQSLHAFRQASAGRANENMSAINISLAWFLKHEHTHFYERTSKENSQGAEIRPS
jgi:hypothetical protein